MLKRTVGSSVRFQSDPVAKHHIQGASQTRNFSLKKKKNRARIRYSTGWIEPCPPVSTSLLIFPLRTSHFTLLFSCCLSIWRCIGDKLIQDGSSQPSKKFTLRFSNSTIFVIGRSKEWLPLVSTKSSRVPRLAILGTIKLSSLPTCLMAWPAYARLSCLETILYVCIPERGYDKGIQRIVSGQSGNAVNDAARGSSDTLLYGLEQFSPRFSYVGCCKGRLQGA